MTFMELAKERYSVRKFSDKPIEKEKLDAILEAGRIAPTGHNYQPYRVYVLQSPEALEKIRGLTRCAFNAPVVLMVTVRKDEEWVNPCQLPATEVASLRESFDTSICLDRPGLLHSQSCEVQQRSGNYQSH